MGFVFNVIASVGRQNDVYRPINIQKILSADCFFNACLFVLVGSLRPRYTAEVMSGRSVILSTLFLGKPPRGSLPGLSAHHFAIN